MGPSGIDQNGTVLNRRALSDLIHDTSLMTLAFAIALGWALFQVAQGLSTFVVTLLGNYSRDRLAIYPGFPEFGGALVWTVGDRVIFLSPLLGGLIELGLVLLVVLAVRRATAAQSDSP